MRRQKVQDEDTLSVVNETKPLVNGHHASSHLSDGDHGHGHSHGHNHDHNHDHDHEKKEPINRKRICKCMQDLEDMHPLRQ